MTALAVFVAFWIALAGEQERPRRFSDQHPLIQSGTVGVRGRVVFHITDIRPESPAARAGLRVNDIVLAIDDMEVRSADDVYRTILDPLQRPGRQYRIRYARFNPRTQAYELSTVKVTSQ